MTEFVDCDSDIELFEMSAEKSEKALLVNTTDRDKISYSSADDSVNVGNEPGHRKVVLNKQKEKTKLSGFLLLLSFFAAIGGFLFGYDTGVVSGAMLLLKTNFDLSSFSEEVIVSVTIGSAAVFSICSGVLNEYLGRKLTIIIGSFVFTAGAIVLAVAQNIAMLISGRAILGIGIGIASMTVPTYIAECAPSELRGRLVTINNLFITGGQFIASVLDGAFSYDKTNGWRYMFGLAGVPSAIQFVGFFFLPESPRWLISKGKEVEARKVLCKIRGHSYVEEELQEIIQKFEEERESTNKAEEYIIVRVIKTPSVRRALILGSFLQIFQQLSGINTVMYYSATIIQMTGIRSQSTAIWLAAVTAFVNFIFTLVGVWLVDKIGRRKLILSSLAGVLFSLVVLAVGFQMTALNSPPVTTFESSSNNSKCFQYRSCESCTESLQCGFCYIEKNTYSAENGSCLPYTDPSMSSEGRCNSTKLEINLVWAENYCPSPYSILGLIGLIIYLMAFAPGTYWLFVGIVIIGFIIIYATLPETKGKKLEEVQALFEKGWCSDSQYDQLKNCNETTIDAN
ncbi:proton myo-inositol cotransporter-like isoform X2 [Mytilus galloprovincialis]|uniref:proton myo-inositol cotransporter-like isoform X2 n=1 Tax=Mytilus galloprovincialis TaxID=29158 RepID=UPI003F7B608C